MKSIKSSIIFLTLFVLCSLNLFGQPDHLYIDLKEALKTPDKVYQLDLTLNELKKAEVKKLGNFKNLQKLELAHCGLNHFPKSILNCKELKYLNLGHNSIKNIPEEISQLSQLEELIIRSNEIDIFPSSIFELPNLNNLDLLSSKSIVPLPLGLLKMKSLKSLHCSSTNNEFENIICKMPWLKEIEIYTKEFISPCQIYPLTNIEKFQMLLAIGSQIEFFDCSLKSLEQMKEFSIMYHTSRMPLIELSKEEITQIKSLLPSDCALKGIRDKNEILKTIIDLR
jgi:Leucine-rich repeat (LRR) protein